VQPFTAHFIDLDVFFEGTGGGGATEALEETEEGWMYPKLLERESPVSKLMPLEAG
jgi:hypothetical protein